MKYRLAWLLVLATGAAFEQNAFWLDLSGEWRTEQGDDARYAAVEFDDSGWQAVRAPNPLGSMRLPNAFAWLRRTLHLPPGTPREYLALTIGKTAEYFQIFVNGALVETVGSFERSGLKIARPHTVDLPVLQGERVTIAIRVWFHPYIGVTAAWTRPDDTGPWVLSSRESAPRLAGEAFMSRLRTLRTPNLAYGAAALMLALPATEVGGDFHRSRTDADGSLMAVVGDVSGKGLKAAMLVSVVAGFLRNEKSASPAAILQALNDGLTGHTGGGFVTCCCARFDASGSVTLANAGHPSPNCDGSEVAVEASMPLGVAAGVAYEESVVRGERFAFVSDVVVEAENAHRELFDFDRTREISTKSVHEIAEAAKAWGKNDDITVVTVRRNA